MISTSEWRGFTKIQLKSLHLHQNCAGYQIMGTNRDFNYCFLTSFVGVKCIQCRSRRLLSLTCSPGPHCCLGPSCPAAGRIPPYSASRPPGRLWAAGSGSSDWPVSCGWATWWTDAACAGAELVGEEAGLADCTGGHLGRSKGEKHIWSVKFEHQEWLCHRGCTTNSMEASRATRAIQKSKYNQERHYNEKDHCKKKENKECFYSKAHNNFCKNARQLTVGFS